MEDLNLPPHALLRRAFNSSPENHSRQVPELHPRFPQTQENHYLPNLIPEFHPMSSFTNTEENHYLPNPIPEFQPMSGIPSTQENHYLPNPRREYHQISGFTDTQENDLPRPLNLGETGGSYNVIHDSRDLDGDFVDNTGGFAYPEYNADILDFLYSPENNLCFGGNSCFPGSLESAFNRLNISPPPIRIGSFNDPFDPDNYDTPECKKQANIKRLIMELERRYNLDYLLQQWRYRQGNPHQDPQFYKSTTWWKRKIVEFAKTKLGCNALKENLSYLRNIDTLVSALIHDGDEICEIMMNQFGHNLVEPLLSVCDGKQINEIIIATFTKANLETICLNMYGSRAMRKLMHYVVGHQIELTLAQMSGVTVRLAKDINGRHVIECCLKKFNFEFTQLQEMMHEIANAYFELALDRYGCRVLQQCVDKAEDSLKARLIADITFNAVVFSKNSHGNYVVQKIVEIGGEARDGVLEMLEGHYMSLSLDKFGSNVVQKCLHDPTCSNEQIASIIRELMYHPNFLELMLSEYGNYVAQSAIEKSKGYVRNQLIRIIRGHKASIQNHPFGSRVWKILRHFLRTD